jgi:ribonuclease HII
MVKKAKEKINKKVNYLTGSTFELEKSLIEAGYKLIVGIDEAGRGPLAGPVVAGAVSFKNNYSDWDNKFLDLIRDSKTLSEKQRESLFDFIHENFYVGIGICDHHTIDRVNILEASFLAMKSAIASLSHNIKPAYRTGRHEKWNKKKIILLDGNKEIPNISIEQKCIVSGDKIVKSISAASIVAKVTRDRMMKEMHKKYPQYNFLQHKGYGTKIHMDALKKYGPCEIHRKSFRPVRKYLMNLS